MGFRNRAHVRGEAVFGNNAPESGNAELLAIAGTPEQKERWIMAPLREPLHVAEELRTGVLLCHR